jgi:hypothetical protein
MRVKMNRELREWYAALKDHRYPSVDDIKGIVSLLDSYVALVRNGAIILQNDEHLAEVYMAKTGIDSKRDIKTRLRPLLCMQIDTEDVKCISYLLAQGGIDALKREAATHEIHYRRLASEGELPAIYVPEGFNTEMPTGQEQLEIICKDVTLSLSRAYALNAFSAQKELIHAYLKSRIVESAFDDNGPTFRIVNASESEPRSLSKQQIDLIGDSFFYQSHVNMSCARAVSIFYLSKMGSKEPEYTTETMMQVLFAQRQDGQPFDGLVRDRIVKEILPN